VITGALNWHWIFLVNVPIGMAVYLLSLRLLPGNTKKTTQQHLDVFGAITITGCLLLAVFAIVNGNQAGWSSLQTLGLLTIAIILLAVFLRIESKAPSPLMPPNLFRIRNVRTANIIGVMWAAAMFAWFFISALYLQLILGYSPLKVGLSFLPTNLIMAVFSIGLSAKLVIRFGIRRTITVGLLLAGSGLLLFAQAPVNGHFVANILPSMLLLGFGAGIAFNPILLAAMSDVTPDESGLASGIVNTSFMMGGALGLAILASIAASRSNSLLHRGFAEKAALTGGYHIAFLCGGIFAIIAALIGAFVIQTTGKQVSH
jgi:MFS family permease